MEHSTSSPSAITVFNVYPIFKTQLIQDFIEKFTKENSFISKTEKSPSYISRLLKRQEIVARDAAYQVSA